MRDLALFDALTGLPTRTLFADRLGRSLLTAERNQASCALLSLDLDGFKAVNDSAGHEAGDAILQEIARRLVCAVRTMDTVCRWGGDEFLILTPQSGSREALTETARRLLERVAEPIALGGGTYRVSASIGIAQFPADGRTAAALEAAADAAMYRAKRAGKGRVVLAGDNAAALDPAGAPKGAGTGTPRG